MRNRIELSARLQRVADFLPRSGVFADIGSDHAHLPIYMVLQFPGVRAIAGEVVQGPYEAAVRSVRKYGVANRVDCRFGDGLTVVEPGEAGAVSICGMGGGTIRQILDRSPQVVEQLETLVLQPNKHAAEVRMWAAVSGWQVKDEDIVEDAGILYDVLLLQKAGSPRHSDGQNQPAKTLELLFGPLNLQRKHPLLPVCIREELERCQRALTGIRQAAKTAETVQKEQSLQELSVQLARLLSDHESYRTGR